MKKEGSTIRFALVGAGHIGQRHAGQIIRFGKLSAVADPLLSRAQSLASGPGAAVYGSLEEILAAERPDVVCICTPNYLHASQSIAALQAGCHVLCEKPMCLHETDARAMIRAAAEADRHLFIVKQNRFNPPVQYVRGLLQEGRLGKIHSFQINCLWHRPAAYYQQSDWHGRAARDGGILFTQFSHFVDLLYWLLGPVHSVKSFRDNFLLKTVVEGEDTGVVALRMASGAVGTLHYTVSAYDKNMEGSITLMGDRGTVKIGGQYLNVLEYFCVEGLEAPTLAASRPANQYGSYSGSMSNHDKVYEELIHALEGRPYDLASAEQAAATISLIETINAAGL